MDIEEHPANESIPGSGTNVDCKKTPTAPASSGDRQRKHFRRASRLLLAALMMAVLGCASSAPTDPLTSPQTIVFPLLDLRANKAVKIECTPARPVSANFLGGATQSIVHFAVDEGLQSNLTLDDLVAGIPGKLKAIPHKGEQYALFFSLSRWEFGVPPFNFKYDMSVFLIRISTGEVIWKNRVEDSKWEGVIQGPLDKAFGGPTDFHYGTLLMEVLKGCPNDLPM